MTTIIARYKNTFIAGMLLLLATAGSSCKKDTPGEGTPATVQLYNALNDKIQLYVNLSGKPLPSYRSGLMLGNKIFSRNSNLYLRDLPQTLDLFAIPDTMPHNTPLISAKLDLQPGKIYSLFIFGNKLNADYLLREDQYPVLNYTDSTSFVRFANMSDGAPISVNLKGEPEGSFVQELPFKSLSGFQTLPLSMTIDRQEFEIRDKATGTLLATYLTPPWDFAFLNYNSWVFKPVTLVFTGVPQGTGNNQQTVIAMAHISR